MAGILSRSASGGGPPRMLKPSQELLDDLCSRFVLNAPDEELQSFERIMFLIEQAHWFYEDNCREQYPSLKAMSNFEFAALMFQSCASLRPYIANIDDIYKDFTSYKVRVPVTGAIIVDSSYEKVKAYGVAWVDVTFQGQRSGFYQSIDKMGPVGSVVGCKKPTKMH